MFIAAVVVTLAVFQYRWNQAASDAAGVRLAVSKQARILNLMLDDFFHERGISEQRLHELIGHTPVQVFAGALVGIIFGVLLT